MNRKTIAMLCLLSAFVATAQNLRRPAPGRGARTERVGQAAMVTFDTVSAPPADSIAVAGFEKPQRSMRETMFVTNNTSRPVVAAGIDITYLDSSGRMLHRAFHDVELCIPPGETRRADVRSFDSSGLFYYRLSPRAPRAERATPFDVKVKITYITHPILKK